MLVKNRNALIININNQINIQYFFITDPIIYGEVKLNCFPTGDIIS